MKAGEGRRPLLFHLICQSSYVAICIHYLKWARYWDWFLLSLLLAVSLNAVAIFVFRRAAKLKDYFQLSPLVIATSTFLFVAGIGFGTYAVAISIAILSRFLLRTKEGHVFNPSNIAIVCLLALGIGIYVTPSVNVQDGSLWLPWLFGVGTLNAIVARRWIAAYSYFLSFVVAEFLLHLAGAPYALLNIASLLSINSGLFAFHVMTDPKTSPAAPMRQVVFGGVIGVAEVVLRAFSIILPNMIALALVCAGFVFWARRENPLGVKFLPLGALAGALAVGLISGHIPLLDPIQHGIYQADTAAVKPPFHFTEVSHQLGLTIRQGAEPPSQNRSLFLNDFTGTSFSVTRLTDDGYLDVVAVSPWNDLRVFKNEGGERFTDVTERLGLGPAVLGKVATAATFDFDNDGREDLFLISADTPQRFRLFRNTGAGFAEVTASVRLPSENLGVAKSINFLDYDNDGFLDVVVANYPLPAHDKGDLSSKVFVASAKKNHLLKNHGGKFFTDETDATGIGESASDFTHAVGVSDMNGDGYPDLYFSNDFGRDRLFLNRQGKVFENAVEQMLGHLIPRNGMNAEFADVDGTGYQDLYVTNITTSRVADGMNYLWKNQGGNGFVNVANDYDIGRCGFSWGAKFFDANLDGNLDLFVAAGSRGGRIPIWYPITVWANVPNFLKVTPLVSHQFPKDADFAARQRSCFFWRHEGKYADVAEAAGLGEKSETYSVALLDIDNSGRDSLLLGSFGFYGRPAVRLFRPDLPNRNYWVGFSLVGVKSNRNAYGAKVTLLRNGRKFSKELYPGNSISSHSDPRLVFGLGQDGAPVNLDIRWPSGLQQSFRGIRPGAYYRITEGKSAERQSSKIVVGELPR